MKWNQIVWNIQMKISDNCRILLLLPLFLIFYINIDKSSRKMTNNFGITQNDLC